MLLCVWKGPNSTLVEGSALGLKSETYCYVHKHDSHIKFSNEFSIFSPQDDLHIALAGNRFKVCGLINFVC